MDCPRYEPNSRCRCGAARPSSAVLDVERVEIDAFGPDELEVLTLFASQAAIAIENARLFEAQRRRVFELDTVQSIVQKLTALHDREAVADLGRQRTRRTHRLQRLCGVHLRRRAAGTAPVRANSTSSPFMSIRIGEGLTGWVARHGQSQIVNDSLLDARAAPIPGTPVRASR